MFRLSSVVLLTFAGLTEAVYLWNSPECQALIAPPVTDSCVAPGSIPGGSPVCPKCMYDEQCASGWCVSPWKVCYAPGLGGCYTHADHVAHCTNCPSDPSIDQTQCNCASPNFPINWVDCTDGSGGKFTPQLADSYQPKYHSSSGGLASDDEFAITLQCYHNKMREAAGLQPLAWNNTLAAFALGYSEDLCDAGCSLQHSSGSDRYYSGENLYAAWSSQPLIYADTTDAGKRSVEAWYEEIKHYNYKGEGEPHRACAQDGVIGHFTQVMWESTTSIGCGFAYNYNQQRIAISCNYSPAGNWLNRQAFDNDAFCNMKNWSENIQKYGNITWCGSGSDPC